MPIDSVMKHYKEKFSLIRKIIAKENPTIVEVGAHYGEDSMRFLETFPKAKIYCFEPDPRNIEVFKQYVTDPRAILNTTALAAEDGTAEFYQSYQPSEVQVPEKYDWIDQSVYDGKKINSSGASSLKKGHAHLLGPPISVKTGRFDTWYAAHDEVVEIDLVWIDVQGAEKDVIDGMGDAAKNIRFVWVEYGELQYEDALSRLETVSLMKTLGFSVVEPLSDSGSAGDLLFRRTA